MSVESLPIFSYFNKQRFTQYGCMDCANWYGAASQDTKKGQALYPAMGRKHIRYFGENKLIFDSEPSFIFKTIDFFYVVVGTAVIQVNKNYEQTVIGNIPLGKTVWFDYLAVGNLIYAMLTAETVIYVITENGAAVTMQQVTDPRAPQSPYFVAAFGNRFVVSNKNSPDFYLSQVNLGGVFNPATCFSFGDPSAYFSLFSQASDTIGQLGVLHNQLYIFGKFTTEVWANIPTQITIGGVTREFPFKKNTSYNFDYGIYDPFSLSIDFGMMAWMGNNRNGLVSFLSSNGQQPENISSQAINVVLENSTGDHDTLSPFLIGPTDGFLYQYENTIFYRVSAGQYVNYGDLDINDLAYSLEYNFATKTWARVIELNGERNRIQKHIYFNNIHIVSVLGDAALYQMGGNIYYNELRTAGTNPQDTNAFTAYPIRYELVTRQIYQEDYSEFITDYVEIDFVFGNGFYKSDAPFDNTIFIITEDAAPDGGPVFCITEDAAPDGSPVFMIIEGTNTPSLLDNHYNALFKPHVELYYSDDGGMTFTSADVREFSQIGQYQWRMRWYELGTSRNRCYMLVGVSPAPIVVLGAVHDVRRASGGAN